MDRPERRYVQEQAKQDWCYTWRWLADLGDCVLVGVREDYKPDVLRRDSDNDDEDKDGFLCI